MTCYWKRSCCRRRPHHIRRASAANAARRQKMSAASHGYEEYLAALADPDHEEHEDMLRWRGPFDPETFSTAQVNQGLQKKFRSRKLTKVANPV